MNTAKLVQVTGTIFLVIFFYTSSVVLTFYNKWMSKSYRFPLTISMVHFIVIFIISSIFRKLLEGYQKEKRIVLEWNVYLRKVFPSAISASLDIGLSNWSIMLSTISIYTMAKSTSIIFILLFSLLFGLEKPTKSLLVVVTLIAVGLFLFTYHSKQFDMTGFLLALLASLFSGIRWTTAQLIMQKKSIGLTNPVDAIFHIQPVMALTIMGFAFSIEGEEVASSSLLFRYESLHVAIVSLLTILVGALLAFFLTVSEYLLVANTSSLALSISAILKELVTLTLAAEVSGDRMNGVNFIGLVICMSGISIHVVSKALKESDDYRNRSLHLEDSRDPIAFQSLLTEDDFEEEVLLEMSMTKKKLRR